MASGSISPRIVAELMVVDNVNERMQGVQALEHGVTLVRGNLTRPLRVFFLRGTGMERERGKTLPLLSWAES